MQLWEAIEVYLNRKVDFTEEVIITNDGHSDETIIWNVTDKVVPTQEELDALLPLESPITVFYDNDNFIWGRSKEYVNTGFEDYNSKLIYCTHTAEYEDDEPVIDTDYLIPLKKLDETDMPVVITDPSDYLVNPLLWNRFLSKVRVGIRTDLKEKSKEENRILYEASPVYAQDIYKEEIDLKYAVEMPQYPINLVTESSIKLLFSLLYIKDVEGREWTTDEKTAYDGLLTRFYNHSFIIQPFNGMNWSDYYQEDILTSLDTLRMMAIPERIYITGE